MNERRILTIDDDADINNYLKVILKKNSYAIETATSLEEFFKKIVSFKPHLCLVDLNIGDFNGVGFKIIEMMRRKIGNQIIIIIMSRRDSDEDIQLALECGANDYIQKPLDNKILMSKVDLYLERFNEQNAFPFFAIPTGDLECFFELPLTIHSITEEYIRVLSKNYIAKGTYIEINNGFLAGHNFIIKEVTLDREHGGYIFKIELDEQEHAALFPAIRKILIESPPIT
ncbi:PleD family two-component system response regulator [Bacteriovorax sp. Seq25_V]|uniref:response regulator n=1 Tax=Bacteriovorax sp. Seq25_V TaxID=1201288 RepID=UPI00038A5583|nr:response regulator [Bacteriovorax sp. Seq25_V]EQC43892.1 response regulator receiver domain protein [Bacteriovorax sp. Seq25_V]